MSPAVKEILTQIEALDDSDRMELDRELARLLEQEWERESKKARKIARARGITQSVIDETIERHRYGRRTP